ncbi:MAG: CDP-glycerol glycerophosphotransferase family protein [Mogibacterium sp.]|nr:CDP-glycerol glycerophosphotransferase family protein [Mogibacterium sp.]
MGNNDSLKEKYRGFRNEPIKENCIVFESLWGRNYSCSPAAFYEFIIENHPEYECVWFLNDADTPVKGNAKKVERKTEEFYRYLATAKYFVYNTNLPLSFVKREGQVIIQTMHGTPFKTFGLDVKDEISTDKERLRAVKRAAMWDYLVAQGEFTKRMAWRWFRYRNNVLETGYPRTDRLFHTDEDAASGLREEMGIPEDKKVILYAPTWRDLDRFDMELDIEAMRNALSDEYVLLIRPHYFVAEYYKVPEDGKFIFDAGNVSTIEDLFPVTDVLITDYSSVMFDFSLTGKPMVFYAYDLKEYTENTRGSYFDISTEAPGCLALTTDEVIDSIENLDSFYDIHGERIQAFCKKYLTYENGKSSEIIFDKVFVREEQERRVLIRNRAIAVARRVLPHKIYTYLMESSMKRALNNESHTD